MSRHDDVSCDSCMESNFLGKRFKCLVCYDYDLCGTCYERGATSGNHSADHPVQCLLAPNDLELYYGSENVRHLSSYTCPLCGQMGYSVSSLRDHVLADHAFDSAREVICPVCVATAVGQAYDQNHFSDEFALHMEHDHRSDSGNDGDQMRTRTESEGSSGELRTVLDRQMARRGTGRIASRSSRAGSSRLADSSAVSSEERTLNLVRGRGIFRERESRDRNSNSTAPVAHQPPPQPQPTSGLRLVANLREHSNDPLAELLSHMANSRAVIYDSSAGRGRGRSLAMLAPQGGGTTVAAQLEQQLQSARTLLEELQHLERLPQPQRANPPPPQQQQLSAANRFGNVVLLGGPMDISQQQQQTQQQSIQQTPATRSSSGNAGRQSALSRWCDEREKELGSNRWNADDARSRALFVQEALIGLMTASCKETIL